MSSFKSFGIGGMALLLVAALVVQHRATTRMNDQFAALRTEVQRLSDRLLAEQLAHAKPATPEPQTPSPAPVTDDLQAQVRRLADEVARLQERLAQLESARDASTNQAAAGGGGNTPFVYPDSIRRKDYAFSGYAAPQSALKSMFWALAQSDARAYQASVTGVTAEAFASASKDLPSGVMPGGYRNGSLFRAAGFRVLDEAPLSVDETQLKVFLEGQNLVLKLIFQRSGSEWKMARTEL